MYCIIEAMIARSSDVVLMKPQLVDIPQFLLGDSDRLRGCLLNLYTNAAKFTRRGAISLRVSVHGPNYRPRPAQHAALYEKEASLIHSKDCLGISLDNVMQLSSASSYLIEFPRVSMINWESLAGFHLSNTRTLHQEEQILCVKFCLPLHCKYGLTLGQWIHLRSSKF